MTWTKGNHKGEWEVEIRALRGTVKGYDGFIVASGHDIDGVFIDNPADRRLFQLAPRMADAILEWLESLSYTDHIPEKLMEIAEELEQLKAGK